MLVYIPEYLTSQTVTGWWAGWAIVVAQMLLGMPRGAKQRIPDKLARIQDRGKAHGVSFAFTRR